MLTVVVTVSDRSARGERVDASGSLARELLAEYGVKFIDSEVRVCPDGRENVTSVVRAAVKAGAEFVFTTGGTGVCPRDLTPEASAELITTPLPALEAAITAKSLSATPFAALSRGKAGLIASKGEHGESRQVLLVNAPGSPSGVRDVIAVVGPLLGHLRSQLSGGDH